MTEEQVTPDRLDELDRRVYELAIQPIPLAEIAVRLGVPVAQADERIQRVCARLGVADRVALRTPAREVAIEAPQDIPPPETDEDTARPPYRRISRRTIVVGGGAVAAVAALTAAGVLVRPRKGSRPPAATTPATGTPVPSGLDPLVELPFADTWEVRTFAKGELIDWPHGLFLMGVQGGEVRAHRLRVPDALNYQTWPGGRFVSGSKFNRGDSPPVDFLMDILNTDTAWEWDPQKLRLVAVSESLPRATVLFERVSDVRQTGEFVAYLSSRPGADLNLSSQPLGFGSNFPGRVLVAPKQVGIATSTIGDHPGLNIFETGSSRVTLVPLPNGLSKVPFEAGNSVVVSDLQPVVGPESGQDEILVSLRRLQAPGEKTLDEWALRLHWNGVPASDAFRITSPVAFSTDGLLYLREVPLRSVTSEGADGPREYWPAVEIVETQTGKVLQRVRSAAVYYGDGGPSNRWSDPTSFLALVRTAWAEDGYDAAHFVQSPKRPGWEILERYEAPLDPSLQGTWYQSPWVQGVVPSPTDPRRIALGRFATLDLTDGQLVKANIRNETGPAHIDPWAAGSNWLAFSFPHLGHGGASPPILLQPKFEAGDTIESPLRFKVASNRVYPPGAPFFLMPPADRLNLRQEPSLSGKVIAALENGAALTQAESPDPNRPQGRRGVEQLPDATWLYVRADSGLEGWVNSAYVEWA